MSDKADTTAAALRTGYWHEATRPLVSLVFVAPILVFYEAGILLLGPHAVRNAADVWLRALLDLIGFGHYFLLPVLTCGVLLAWHHVSRQPWKFHVSVLYGMLLESLVFGFLLLVVAGWQRALLSAMPPASLDTGAGDSLASLLVGYLGAGVYEELLFRLLLLPPAIGLLRMAGLSRRTSLIAAVIVVSLLFSAAHYQVAFTIGQFQFAAPYGEPFGWFSFSFRFLAGVLFSLLFLYRGFGIAAGSHALYDLFTLVM